MKTKAQVIANSLAVLLICTLLFSLVFASLYYFAKISTNTFHILNWIFGVIAFLAGGCMLGYKVNKKALLHALIIVFILAVIMFLLSGFSLMNMIEIISKCIAYIAGSVVMYNLSHQRVS